ncbi:MAG: hypothetical protein Q7R93_03435 [bacterium]|nr:hypothetical protein [bacterium]
MDKTAPLLSGFFKKHSLAVAVALLVGIIYLAPHLMFVLSLGDEYHGIPMLQTQNQDYYFTRIREIIDGHYSTGSFMFYEYKDSPPLTPPTEEFLYALPTLLFGISYVDTAIASEFVLPFVLFLLVYFLISRLTKKPDSLWHKMNAIAGGLFVLLGYDLINYRGVFEFLVGRDTIAGSFLVWSRLVHPVWGAIFLFAFLLCLWELIHTTEKRRRIIACGAVLMALMFASYFFSWGLALSVWGALLLIYLLKKEWRVAKDLLFLMGGGIVLATPYWINLWNAAQSPWYADSVMRSGLFLTHYPLINKFVLAVFLFYALLVWGIPYGQCLLSGNRTRREPLETWQWFTLAMLLGSFWVYVEQVVTGRTIWPYHFPQYTIPLCIVVFLTLCFNFVWATARENRTVQCSLTALWWTGIAVIAGSSLLFGVAVQTTVYRNSYQRYADMQKYAPIFAYLNEQGKECVVLTKSDERRNWNFFVPAFTSCDIYAESGISILMPFERVYHNYLVNLRLRGVRDDTLEDYLKKNPRGPLEYLYSNWKGLYGVKDFPDFSDPLLVERLKKLPDDYRTFFAEDFKKELKEYRLDYILSIGPLDQDTLKELSGTTLVETAGDMYLYTFK